MKPFLIGLIVILLFSTLVESQTDAGTIGTKIPNACYNSILDAGEGSSECPTCFDCGKACGNSCPWDICYNDNNCAKGMFCNLNIKPLPRCTILAEGKGDCYIKPEAPSAECEEICAQKEPDFGSDQKQNNINFYLNKKEMDSSRKCNCGKKQECPGRDIKSSHYTIEQCDQLISSCVNNEFTLPNYQKCYHKYQDICPSNCLSCTSFVSGIMTDYASVEDNYPECTPRPNAGTLESELCKIGGFGTHPTLAACTEESNIIAVCKKQSFSCTNKCKQIYDYTANPISSIINICADDEINYREGGSICDQYNAWLDYKKVNGRKRSLIRSAYLLEHDEFFSCEKEWKKSYPPSSTPGCSESTCCGGYYSLCKKLYKLGNSDCLTSEFPNINCLTDYFKCQDLLKKAEKLKKEAAGLRPPGYSSNSPKKAADPSCKYTNLIINPSSCSNKPAPCCEEILGEKPEDKLKLDVCKANQVKKKYNLCEVELNKCVNEIKNTLSITEDDAAQKCLNAFGNIKNCFDNLVYPESYSATEKCIPLCNEESKIICRPQLAYGDIYSTCLSEKTSACTSTCLAGDPNDIGKTCKTCTKLNYGKMWLFALDKLNSVFEGKLSDFIKKILLSFGNLGGLLNSLIDAANKLSSPISPIILSDFPCASDMLKEFFNIEDKEVNLIVQGIEPVELEQKRTDLISAEQTNLIKRKNLIDDYVSNKCSSFESNPFSSGLSEGLEISCRYKANLEAEKLPSVKEIDGELNKLKMDLKLEELKYANNRDKASLLFEERKQIFRDNLGDEDRKIAVMKAFERANQIQQNEAARNAEIDSKCKPSYSSSNYDTATQLEYQKCINQFGASKITLKDYLSDAAYQLSNLDLLLKYEVQLKSFDTAKLNEEKEELQASLSELNNELIKNKNNPILYSNFKYALDLVKEKYVFLLIKELNGKHKISANDALAEAQDNLKSTVNLLYKNVDQITEEDLNNPLFYERNDFIVEALTSELDETNAKMLRLNAIYRDIWRKVRDYFVLHADKDHSQLIGTKYERMALEMIGYIYSLEEIDKQIKTVRESTNSVSAPIIARLNPIYDEIKLLQKVIVNNQKILDNPDYNPEYEYGDLTKEQIRSRITSDDNRISELNVLIKPDEDAAAKLNYDLITKIRALNNVKNQIIEQEYKFINRFIGFEFGGKGQDKFKDLLAKEGIEINFLYAQQYYHALQSYLEQKSSFWTGDVATWIQQVIMGTGIKSELETRSLLYLEAKGDNYNMRLVNEVLNKCPSITTSMIRAKIVTPALVAECYSGNPSTIVVQVVMDAQEKNLFEPSKRVPIDKLIKPEALQDGIINKLTNPVDLGITFGAMSLARAPIALIRAFPLAKWFPTFSKIPGMSFISTGFLEGIGFHYISGVARNKLMGVPFDPYDWKGYAWSGIMFLGFKAPGELLRLGITTKSLSKAFSKEFQMEMALEESSAKFSSMSFQLANIVGMAGTGIVLETGAEIYNHGFDIPPEKIGDIAANSIANILVYELVGRMIHPATGALARWVQGIENKPLSDAEFSRRVKDGNIALKNRQYDLWYKAIGPIVSKLPIEPNPKTLSQKISNAENMFVIRMSKAAEAQVEARASIDKLKTVQTLDEFNNINKEILQKKTDLAQKEYDMLKQYFEKVDFDKSRMTESDALLFDAQKDMLLNQKEIEILRLQQVDDSIDLELKSIKAEKDALEFDKKFNEALKNREISGQKPTEEIIKKWQKSDASKNSAEEKAMTDLLKRRLDIDERIANEIKACTI